MIDPRTGRPFVPHSQIVLRDGTTHGTYEVSSDDWIGDPASLFVVPSYRLTETDRQHCEYFRRQYGEALCYIGGKDETGNESLVMECDGIHTAVSIIVNVPNTRCEECGEPIGIDEPCVLPAASDLEWNFHLRCVVDRDPDARRADTSRGNILPAMRDREVI